jgi:hypothetical protein
VIVASLAAAAVGSVLLATRHSDVETTTRGIAATLRVPGHPGVVRAGDDALWVALSSDPQDTAGDRPLLRLDLASGAVLRAVQVHGEATAITRDGNRLIASVRPVGGNELGPRRLVAFDWRTGDELPLGESHRSDADARPINAPVDQLLPVGSTLWALESRPGRLLQLDPSTLIPFSKPTRLSSGVTLGLAFGAGYLWVTAVDAGDVLRIDPQTSAITRLHVGGAPVGIAVVAGAVWFADRSGGNVVRLDPHLLRPADPVRVGGKPTWLASAGGSLFVSDESAGTLTQIDLRSGRLVGRPIRIAPAAHDAGAPALASAGTSVWVSSPASDTVTRITPRSSPADQSSGVTVRGTGNGPVNPGPSGFGVTDGGVAGRGHFTITGAIVDRGTYIGYRRVVGEIATVRTVLTGRKGTITMVTTIHLGVETPAPWTIRSGTKSYATVRGTGRMTVDNYQADPYSFVLKGIISR